MPRVLAAGLTIGYLGPVCLYQSRFDHGQFLKSSFRSLYELEAKINRLYDESALSCNMEVLNQASLFQEQLERSGFYSIDTHIAPGGFRSGTGLNRFVPSS